MKLELSYADFCTAIKGTHLSGPLHGQVDHVQFDTRKVFSSEFQVFFALHGQFRNGHDFLEEAYEKGIRCFVIDDKNAIQFPDACYFLVKNTLAALQELAAFHRQKFSFPLIAITGSIGKTTVKEWLSFLLNDKLRIVKSPKSYNSQLGVALSLLNLHADCDLAIIEAGISKPGEMQVLEAMIQPTYGILTAIGKAHEENFTSYEQHVEEKLKLFRNVQTCIVGPGVILSEIQLLSIKGKRVTTGDIQKELSLVPFTDKGSLASASIAIATAKWLGKLDVSKIGQLPRLALRLETFEGRDNALIINDTYNLDIDALRLSLEYQLTIAGDRKRIVVVGIDDDFATKRNEIEKEIASFHPHEMIIEKNPDVKRLNIANAVVLLKGSRAAHMEKQAQQLKLKQHKTQVIYNLSALQHNVSVFKKQLPFETKILAMVKAQSYGAGLEKIAEQLQKIGVHYLGVAYADEGVELRNSGIQLPILVMNPDEDGFDACIEHNLQPAVYSFQQLEDLISVLIANDVTGFPVHLKFDTGMHRLGFEPDDLNRLLEIIESQPEIYVAGVYSHLADADNLRDKRFTQWQIQRFSEVVEKLKKRLPNPILAHILNSEGVASFAKSAFDMVRLGIGMYGISSNPTFAKQLLPVLQWKSEVSQVKTIKQGESIGYSRTFIADKKMQIAIIPVGYADGFRRSLSNGKGGVYMNGAFCPTVGRVCMDMIMVDVSKINVQEGDAVEIIGAHQPLEQFAKKMETIPYEVMTSISRRVHRSYTEEV